MKHRLEALLLAFAMILSLLPVPALAFNVNDGTEAAFESAEVVDAATAGLTNTTHAAWTDGCGNGFVLLGFETSNATLARQIETTGTLNAQFNPAFTPLRSSEISFADTSTNAASPGGPDIEALIQSGFDAISGITDESAASNLQESITSYVDGFKTEAESVLTKLHDALASLNVSVSSASPESSSSPSASAEPLPPRSDLENTFESAKVPFVSALGEALTYIQKQVPFVSYNITGSYIGEQLLTWDVAKDNIKISTCNDIKPYDLLQFKRYFYYVYVPVKLNDISTFNSQLSLIDFCDLEYTDASGNKCVVDFGGTKLPRTNGHITYEAGGATSGTVPVDSAGYPSGSSALIQGNTGNLQKPGYIFTGWAVKSVSEDNAFYKNTENACKKIRDLAVDSELLDNLPNAMSLVPTLPNTTPSISTSEITDVASGLVTLTEFAPYIQDTVSDILGIRLDGYYNNTVLKNMRGNVVMTPVWTPVMDCVHIQSGIAYSSAAYYTKPQSDGSPSPSPSVEPSFDPDKVQAEVDATKEMLDMIKNGTWPSSVMRDDCPDTNGDQEGGKPVCMVAYLYQNTESTQTFKDVTMTLSLPQSFAVSTVSDEDNSISDASNKILTISGDTSNCKIESTIYSKDTHSIIVTLSNYSPDDIVAISIPATVDALPALVDCMQQTYLVSAVADGNSVAAKPRTVTIERNTNEQAHVADKYYSVSYRYTGDVTTGEPGNKSSGNASKTYYEKGQAVPVYAPPTRVGYTFKGWSTGDGIIDTAIGLTNKFLMPEKDVVLTGVWTKTGTPTWTPTDTSTQSSKTVTVTYKNANATPPGVILPEPQKVQVGSEYTMYVPPLSSFIKQGYLISGVKIDGTDADSYTAINSVIDTIKGVMNGNSSLTPALAFKAIESIKKWKTLKIGEDNVTITWYWRDDSEDMYSSSKDATYQYNSGIKLTPTEISNLTQVKGKISTMAMLSSTLSISNLAHVAVTGLTATSGSTGTSSESSNKLASGLLAQAAAALATFKVGLSYSYVPSQASSTLESYSARDKLNDIIGEPKVTDIGKQFTIPMTLSAAAAINACSSLVDAKETITNALTSTAKMVGVAPVEEVGDDLTPQTHGGTITDDEPTATLESNSLENGIDTVLSNATTAFLDRVYKDSDTPMNDSIDKLDVAYPIADVATAELAPAVTSLFGSVTQQLSTYENPTITLSGDPQVSLEANNINYLYSNDKFTKDSFLKAVSAIAKYQDTDGNFVTDDAADIQIDARSFDRLNRMIGDAANAGTSYPVTMYYSRDGYSAGKMVYVTLTTTEQPSPAPSDSPSPSPSSNPGGAGGGDGDTPSPSPTPSAPVGGGGTFFTSQHYSYIVGFPDGAVHPYDNITRGEVASIFFRLLSNDMRKTYWGSTSKFSDVSDSDWDCHAISTLTNIGILNGYNDGRFGPGDPITREQVAAIAARLSEKLQSENVRTNTANFSDISDSWAKEDILKCYALGWLKGYQNNWFNPQANMSRAEFCALTNRILKRVPEKESDLAALPKMAVWPDNQDPAAWYYLDIQEATNSHKYTNKSTIDTSIGAPYETWVGELDSINWSVFERINATPDSLIVPD